jgi:alpha-ketoglutaric semialdehyde dehydrogenase
MQLTGQNYIGSRASGAGSRTFFAMDPTKNLDLQPAFHEATPEEIDGSMKVAERAFVEYQQRTGKQRAAFLNAIATELEALGDELIERAVLETALPTPRIIGERGRTTGQLRMFATMVEEGSWVDARIDRANADRKPLPKPDVRRMMVPLGPVVVFGASNFPLAFSAGGGDTASALAAGCSVVVKAHPSHPGTSELTIGAVLRAAKATGMPDGIVSLIHGVDPKVSLALVEHPLAKAVGFTGSLRAGRALFNAAAARPEPIPVYAEMGSTNPVFILPRALAERGSQIADGLKNSVTLGVGQFCTNPGVVVAMADASLESFVSQAGGLMSAAPIGTMLNQGIGRAFADGAKQFSAAAGVTVAGRSAAATTLPTQAAPVAFATSAKAFLANHRLREELFGPSTLIVASDSREQLLEVANQLEGQLTVTIHAAEGEMAEYADLIAVLRRKAGRLVFNSFPTGVEVCAAMHHGGPYPATSDSRSTSVGGAAIERFARPVCFQDFPAHALPPELQDGNPLGIWRMVDQRMTKD